MKKHIPNFITCLNLLSGCIGIVLTFQGNSIYAVYLIWLAMIFDFADGMAARLLHVKSAIGKELDSLADMVTFGVLPSILMFFMLQQVDIGFEYLPYLAFLIAIFSALRLAKFNVDTRQEDSFIGLPTPANALFISSLVFYQDENIDIIILLTAIIFPFLLVAELPLFSLKLKSLNWKRNEIRYIFILISIFLIIFLQLAALPFIIITYILLSVVNNLLMKKNVK